jgi:hypothetical protein
MSREYLRKALAENCLPSALLFSGNEAKVIAIELSSKLLGCTVEHLEVGNHPDLHRLVPEGKSALHTIESIRLAIEQSHEAPFLGQAAVFLIESAERMQPAAANALLKTLEEPSTPSTWILLSERPGDILPTILSRCTRVVCEGEGPSVTFSGEEVRILQTLLKEKPSYPKLTIELDKIEKLIEGEEYQKKAFALLTLVSEHFHQLKLNNPDSLQSWEEPLNHITVALERNIKLFTCLEYIFIKCSNY